jgi:amino acid permease
MALTGIMALTSYTVANAIPFFQDLVSLIGALTSVPLTLTLPALLYRYAIQQVSLWRYSVGSTSSYSLLVYSMIFLVVGLSGALYSIDRDWAYQGKPFSCH